MLEFKFPILKAMYFSCWAFSIIWFFRSRKKVVDNPLSDVCLYHNMRKYASSLQLIRNVNVKGLYIMHHLYEYNFSFSKVPIIGWTTSITNKNKYMFFQILVSKYCQIILHEHTSLLKAQHLSNQKWYNWIYLNYGKILPP